MKDIEYNVVISGEHEQKIIDWGNEPGWVDEHKGLLNDAKMIALIPKKGIKHLPPVVVRLGDGRKWILFSRVFGRSTGGFSNQIRLYAIGWQKAVEDGPSIKSVTWVYPDGGIENTYADAPMLWRQFL